MFKVLVAQSRMIQSERYFAVDIAICFLIYSSYDAQAGGVQKKSPALCSTRGGVPKSGELEAHLKTKCHTVFVKAYEDRTQLQRNVLVCREWD